ncbi:MbeD family mobilization/exclusion protein [Vibrio vulnificus]|nr:MbeD family mobilization/exclusion protein [Vibrio vulnificus]
MTELEKQLLNAFEQLQQQHEAQHTAFADAYKDLEKMFNTTLKENATLRQQVSSLSEQVNGLNVQLQRLEKHYSTK